VILGGELIARNADRFDHRLGRQRATLEAVDADHGARTGHVLQLLPQLGRIVGERFHLFARQGGAERVAAVGGRFLLVLAHLDRRLHLLERQQQQLFVIAAAQPDVRQTARLESGKRRFDDVTPRGQLPDRGDPGGIGVLLPRGGPGCVVAAGHGNSRAGEHGTSRVHDSEAQRRAG
jgi:hypothetical protein